MRDLLVVALSPDDEEIDDAREGFVPPDVFERRYRAMEFPEWLEPGYLWAIDVDRSGDTEIELASGDTVCCADPDQRRWASEMLAAAGWRVILDGREIEAPR